MYVINTNTRSKRKWMGPQAFEKLNAIYGWVCWTLETLDLICTLRLTYGVGQCIGSASCSTLRTISKSIIIIEKNISKKISRGKKNSHVGRQNGIKKKRLLVCNWISLALFFFLSPFIRCDRMFIAWGFEVKSVCGLDLAVTVVHSKAEITISFSFKIIWQRRLIYFPILSRSVWNNPVAMVLSVTIP